VLTSEGKIRDVLIGTPSAGPIADTNDTPVWMAFVDAYKTQEGAFPSPSLFAHGYYVNMKAALMGLEAAGGDTSDGGAKLRAALAPLSFDTPTGKVSLDANRNAVADIFLTEVTEGPDGNLVNNLVKVVPQVNQTLGIDPTEFMALGVANRDNPACP
jgi:branched-chain amino acid transport system substrate-binding protein